jgi:NADPH:quinone reductase-like Zn-dependent oxidoreductase
MGVMLLGVSLPRVLGIEAVGLVESAPGHPVFKKGDVVATCMGGMGHNFDGGYAEYTCVPAGQVLHLPSVTGDHVPWAVLGALPEMTQTAWGSLFTSLRLQPNDRVLIRDGTTSVGLMAAALAKRHGCHVAATTRNLSREIMLKTNGADEVYIDDGAIAAQVRSRYPVEVPPNPEGFPQPYEKG